MVVLGSVCCPWCPGHPNYLCNVDATCCAPSMKFDPMAMFPAGSRIPRCSPKKKVQVTFFKTAPLDLQERGQLFKAWIQQAATLREGVCITLMPVCCRAWG